MKFIIIIIIYYTVRTGYVAQIKILAEGTKDLIRFHINIQFFGTAMVDVRT